MSAMALLAKASYDNIADAPDELTFRKGDIITVLEKDVDGLNGWWLCSLHGRHGIAPGNRLKEIKKLPGVSLPMTYEEQDYAVPRSHESETGEDYAVPRSRMSPTSPGTDYDFPKGDLDDFYDLPKSEVIYSSSVEGDLCQEIYDTPKGETSPQEPNTASPWSSHKTSNTPGPVERTKLDSQGMGVARPVLPAPSEDLYDIPGSILTQDVYDVPKGPDLTKEAPSGAQTDEGPLKQDSIEPNELYDIPVSPKDNLKEVPKGMFGATHDVWVTKENQKNGNAYKLDLNHNKNSQQNVEQQKRSNGGNSSDQKVDNKPRSDNKIESNRESSGSVDSGRSSAEDDDYVDYQEIYGLGRAERPENVYDIPVQTKDSSHPIPVKKTTTSILQRINMSAVKCIKLDSQTALQRLTKLQQAVDATVTKLLSYVKTDWRNPKNLRHQIADIRDITGKVKVALRLLTEFGLSTLVNAQQLPTPEMSGRVSRAIEPLLETYYSVKLALQKLDDQGWKTPLDRPESTHDDLDLIMVYIRSVPENSAKLGMVMRYGAPMLYGPAKAKTAATQVAVSSSSSTYAPQIQKSQSEQCPSPATVRREEVRAKIEKFGAAAMKADSQPLATTSHLAGQIKSGSNQNAVSPTNGNGSKLSPTTVRRLCDLDPPKLPRKDSSSEFVTQSSGVGSLPVWPPVRKDSGETMVWRKNSIEEASKGPPPPKPRLDRKPTVRKRYDLPRTQDQLDARVVKRDHKADEREASVQSPKTHRKCNSDPTDFSEYHEGSNSSGVPQRTSDSFDDGTVLDSGLPSKKVSVHISDTDLPQGPQSPTVRPRPLGHENTPMRTLEMDNGFLLSLSDRELLEFYKYEIDAQLFVLNEAMKNFFSCLEEMQPPKVFVSSSKFVVLSAHKFVFIGDTLHKKIKQSSVRTVIAEVTNKLSGATKLLVNATKRAALQFPAVNAMKEMSTAVANVLDIAVEVHKVVKRTSLT